MRRQWRVIGATFLMLMSAAAPVLGQAGSSVTPAPGGSVRLIGTIVFFV